MRIDLDTLPDDPAILRQMLWDAVHQHGALHAENDKLRPPVGAAQPGPAAARA